MPESSLRAQSVDCRPQEVGTEVERADDERGGPKETSGIGAEWIVAFCALQPHEDPGRVTQRIRIGVDREYARVFGSRIAQAMGGVDQRPPRLGARIDPPGA